MADTVPAGTSLAGRYRIRNIAWLLHPLRPLRDSCEFAPRARSWLTLQAPTHLPVNGVSCAPCAVLQMLATRLRALDTKISQQDSPSALQAVELLDKLAANILANPANSQVHANQSK